MTAPTTTGTFGTSARWLRRPRPVADPRARLVCLPHAGGTATAYAGWADRLPDWVELLCVQYPGRQDRIAEPCLPSVAMMADAVTAALTPYTDLPLYMFGHSMGGMVAYECAVRLEAGSGPSPAALFVSGQLAPHRHTPFLDGLDDATVEAAIRDTGWIEPKVLDHPQLRELVLPMLVADFRAAMAYELAEPVRLRCPIVSYHGRAEPAAAPQELAAWSELTSGGATWRRFDGDHFYLRAREAELVADIVTRMSNCA